MKKLFMTVLAVLVMASCGSNDGGNSNGAGGNTVSNNGAGGAGGGTGSGIGDNGGNNGAGGAANAKNVGGNKIADGDDVFGQFFDERIAIKKAFIFEAGQALDANDPAKYVAAYEKYVDEAVNYLEKYVIFAMAGNLSDEDLERYNEKYELDGKLYLEVSEIKKCAKNDLQFTSWQERKIAKADERMKEAVEKFSDEPKITIERIDKAEGLDKIISVAETLLEKAEQAIRYNNPEIYVSALEVFVDEAISIKNNYGDALSEMSPEEQQKHADKIQKMKQLQLKVNNLDNKLNQLQPSASQKRRVENAVKKLQNAN